MGLLDTLFKPHSLRPNSLKVVVHRIDELRRARIGRSVPLARPIRVDLLVLAEDWVDGV